uniref:Uncharacterized protein n=1 Tax=Arundo donax TaxID=35708 RepID=A0A0A8YWH6_ARUDO
MGCHLFDYFIVSSMHHLHITVHLLEGTWMKLFCSFMCIGSFICI